MNKTKHILIGKIGKSVKFQTYDINTGGDAPIIFFSTISRLNPEYNFYFIGPNELHKLSEEQYDYLFPNHNVYSAFTKESDIPGHYTGILKYFSDRNITPDFALLFNGMVSNVNVNNFLKKKDGDFYRPLAAYSNYAAPYIMTLNNSNIPLYLISEDPRYITVNAKDLYNRERLIFSQIEGNIETYKHITSKTNWEFKTDNIKVIYSGIEKIFMMGLSKTWREDIDIDRKLNNDNNKFIVLSNGHGATTMNRPCSNVSRFPGYNEWILENFKGTEYEGTKIYGKWDDEYYNNYPQIQNKKIIELDDEIKDAKYSLAYSIIPGFVTVKVWELITMGLIPFIHPDYDKNNYLKLPEYLYVKTPQELLSKIRFLDANPEEYKKLLQECIDHIKPSWENGKALNNFIFSTIAKDLNFTYEKVENGIESIFNRFGDRIFK